VFHRSYATARATSIHVLLLVLGLEGHVYPAPDMTICDMLLLLVVTVWMRHNIRDSLKGDWRTQEQFHMLLQEHHDM
jgi:hypothetical protein